MVFGYTALSFSLMLAFLSIIQLSVSISSIILIALNGLFYGANLKLECLGHLVGPLRRFKNKMSTLQFKFYNNYYNYKRKFKTATTV